MSLIYLLMSQSSDETIIEKIKSSNFLELEKSDRQNNTPLILAANFNRFTICEDLLKRKVNVNSINMHGSTALILAAANGNDDLVKLLLENGADPNIETCTTALHIAAENGHHTTASILIKSGARITSIADKYGRTALIAAIDCQNTQVALTILDSDNAHSIVNCVAKGLISPLIFASLTNDIKVAKRLIQLKAEINRSDEYGKTALIHAAENNSCDMIRILLKNGANINHQDNEGKTALIHAVSNQHSEAVDLLLKLGLSPHREILINNHEDYTKKLFYAASEGRISEVKRILSKKNTLYQIDTFIEDHDGNSALKLALVIDDDSEDSIAKIILKHNAASIRTTMGKTRNRKDLDKVKHQLEETKRKTSIIFRSSSEQKDIANPEFINSSNFEKKNKKI